MKRNLPVLTAACLLATGFGPTAAYEAAAPHEPGAGRLLHHAIGEIYDEERTILLAGEVESFLFGNPHSLLHVRVTGDDGVVRTWAVEWRAADRLSRAGLTGDALAPGDAITLCGHPGRDPGAYRLYLLNVARGGIEPGTAAEESALCEREAALEIADLASPSAPDRTGGLTSLPPR